MTELFITFSKSRESVAVDHGLKSTVRSAILATLTHLDFPYDASVSVTFADNEYIHRLNKQYRGVDRHTDVLSFPMYEDGDFPPEECESGALLGDIVLSLERAAEQAGELGNTLTHEVAFLTIHSTLHLLGYDHERSCEEDEEQCRLQREIISGMDV